MTEATLSPTTSSHMPYKTLAIALHWILALLIIGQILGGWYMESLPDDSPQQDSWEIFHISMGLTILLFTLARIAVRLTHRPPALPSELAPWERVLSGISHVVFYVLMLALPLSGWMMKSFPPPPISFWGLFHWPKLPYLASIPEAQGRVLYGQVGYVHRELLITVTLVLLALHVLGALKHQFDGSPVLWRMLPFMRKR